MSTAYLILSSYENSGASHHQHCLTLVHARVCIDINTQTQQPQQPALPFQTSPTAGITLSSLSQMAKYHFQKSGEKCLQKEERYKCNDFHDFSFCKHLFNTIPPPLPPPTSFPLSPNRSSWTWGITSTPGHAWQLQCLFWTSSARNHKSWKSLIHQ